MAAGTHIGGPIMQEKGVPGYCSHARWCELLIDSVFDYAIYTLDPDGFVKSWNPGAERIKGYQAVEIIGQHFSQKYHCRGSRKGTT